MTLVACARTVPGILMPSNFAVFRLTIISNFAGCWTGRSAGFAPTRAADSASLTWLTLGELFRSQSMAMRVALGRVSLSNRSRLPANSGPSWTSPVAYQRRWTAQSAIHLEPYGHIRERPQQFAYIVDRARCAALRGRSVVCPSIPLPTSFPFPTRRHEQVQPRCE